MCCFFFSGGYQKILRLVKIATEIQLFNYYHHPSFPFFFLSSFPFFVITENYIPLLFLKQQNFQREKAPPPLLSK
jgi:hypothetical protein